VCAGSMHTLVLAHAPEALARRDLLEALEMSTGVG
jgi:hypothetical protein